MPDILSKLLLTLLGQVKWLGSRSAALHRIQLKTCRVVQMQYYYS